MLLAPVLLALVALGPPADNSGWVELAGPSGLKAWKAPTNAWAVVGGVRVDPATPKRLASEPGEGILVNGPLGRTTNLVTNESFGDVEAHFEFLIPQGSNAGVKFEGLYEVQILDSYGKDQERLTGADCGGIYPTAELLPTYKYLDKGHPPKVNACRPPGEWQTLDVTFLAPRFDSSGKKVAPARFVKVLLNGHLVQENQDVQTPTGHAHRTPEVATGPILLQADHGPVAFRSVKVRRLDAK